MNFIYLTTNLINNKQYVGSHKGTVCDLYLGSGKILKSAILKYGKENFKRKILKECDIYSNLLFEEKYIKKYNTLIPNGYNISPTGGYIIFDEKLRNKLSIAKNGKKQSNVTKEKRRKSMLGKNTGPKSEETKRKISEANKGHTFNKGRIHSEESRNNMSKAQKGKKLSKETKIKMSEAKSKQIHTKETKIKMSESKMGSKNPMFGKIPWNKGLKKKLD